MNPFELRGPAFLAVYGGFAALILLGAVLTRRQLEADTIPKLPFVDPYLIACLRRGAPEAVRVALLSLLDRRLIEQKGDMLVARAGVVDQVRRPLEQRVLEGLQLPRLAHELSDDEALRAACAPLDAELVQLGLCVNPAQKLVRFVAAALALALLWLVAGTKISVALTRGVHNIGFLITLAGIASVLVVAVLAQRRTPVGDALLADLRTLFDGLKQRAASIDAGGASNELALLVGVFGVDALAGGLRARVERLFPKAFKESSSDSAGSGCGSSCSSSSCGGPLAAPRPSTAPHATPHAHVPCSARRCRWRTWPRSCSRPRSASTKLPGSPRR